jgi:hypothetical protein
MIDDFNQKTQLQEKFINPLPNDNVSGYTIKQIEDGLRGRSSWNGWCEGMIEKHNNPTEVNLSQLFKNWY